jgi:hypothetical protein
MLQVNEYSTVRLLSVVVAMAIAAATAAGQSPPPGPTPAQPQPTDPDQQQLRQSRSALWDNMFGGPGHMSAAAIESVDPRTPPPVTSVQKMTVGELPANYANTILVGRITAVQAYQSNDHRAIYTESTVQAEQVIDQQGSAATAGGTIAIDQPGGSITLSGGRVISHSTSGMGNALANGGRYAFFLVYVPKAQCYELTNAWGLNNGVAVALSPDDLARARNNASQYNGMPEAAFIGALKTLKASYKGNQQ